MEYFIFGILFVAAFASSFIGSLVGGGSLIITSVLLALDVPPLIMVGSRRMASIGGNVGACVRYGSQKKINYKLAFTLIPIGLVGVFVGYWVLFYFKELNLRFLIGVVLLALLTMHILRELRGNQLWRIKNRAVRHAVGQVWAFIAMAVNNLTGAGGGMLLAYDLLLVYRKKILETAATSKFVLLFCNVFAGFLFWSQDKIDWPYVLVMIVGHLLGGYIGARFYLKQSEPVLRIFLYGIVVLMIIRILVFS